MRSHQVSNGLAYPSSRLSSISFPSRLLHPVLEPVHCGDVHVDGGVLNPFLYHMSTHTHTHIISHMHTLVQQNSLVLVHQW